MDVRLVWAQASNRAIGRGNTLPWRLPEDLAFFKHLTMGAPIIMGRKTWDSFGGRVLPGRHNIVVSSSPRDDTQASWVPSLEAALDEASRGPCCDADSAFVIGGAALYATALPFAARLYVTHVEVDVPDADTFAPAIPVERLHLHHESSRVMSKTGLTFVVREYRASNIALAA